MWRPGSQILRRLEKQQELEGIIIKPKKKMKPNSQNGHTAKNQAKSKRPIWEKKQ